MTNGCDEKDVITYNPSQEFLRRYFTPNNPYKGMLLVHSVGTGKTCSAIAVASTSFESQGWTILWVTRSKLTKDLYKNLFVNTCSQTILKSKKRVPEDGRGRMAMIKQWLPPITYKTFTNLLSGRNAIREQLVRRNGNTDPLRKTLIVIDEAHKLYGGNDLVQAERPDMSKLHSALMHSYTASGNDSAKVLLMTATPITKEPMELVKLLNLIRPANRQMPVKFEQFAAEYGVSLETGKFSSQGRSQFQNQIVGNVSYLDRSKDPSQFARPIIYDTIDVSAGKIGITAEDVQDKYKSDMIKVKEAMSGLKSQATNVRKSFADKKRELVAFCKTMPTREARANCLVRLQDLTAETQELMDAIQTANNAVKHEAEMIKKERDLMLKEALGGQSKGGPVDLPTVLQKTCGLV
jgi:hypothetical protein